MTAALVWLLAAALSGAAQDRSTPRPTPGPKVVLIAGPITGHGKGTHEYERSVVLLRELLERSPDLAGAVVEAHFGGWPEDEGSLDDADTIVLISDGGDRREHDHPLYVAERLARFERQAARGCGVVHLHWTTFHPARLHDRVTEWLGAYFDYESGPEPGRWYSRIETREWELGLPRPDHPVCRGVQPFRLQEEFYFRLRFRDDDPRLVPLASIETADQRASMVGWALERDDGGRSFGFTGGHFFEHWWRPDFRRLIVNAIAWTAGAEVPPEGVRTDPFEPIHAWIVTGHHHPGHDWRALTWALLGALEQDPRMRVRVTEDPEDLAHEELQSCDLVVMNYNNWDRGGLSPAARGNFRRWLAEGGGLGVIHFANGAFTDTIPAAGSDWEEWRTRIVRRVWVHGPGRSGHDAFGPFRVTITDEEHPITRGLADFDTTDELYYRQEGTLPIAPLAAARSADTGADEPMAWADDYEKGRVFQTVLGHADVSVIAAAALIRRGCTWATRREPLGFDPPVEGLATRLVRDGEPWTVALSQARSGSSAAQLDGARAEGRFGQGLAGPMLVTGERPWRSPPLTIECWCRLDAKDGYNILIAQETKASGSHWELYTSANTGYLRAYLPGATEAHVNSELDVCDGRWHHVGMVYEPERVRLYADGRLVGDAATRAAGKPSIAGGLAIGGLVEGGLGCEGVVDEVRIRRGAHPLNSTPAAPLERDARTLALWTFDED